MAEISTPENDLEIFKNFLNVIPDMISIHDKDFNIIYSNWNGWGAVSQDKRIIGSKCYKTYRNINHVCDDCQAGKVLETKEPFQDEIILPDGTWVNLRVIPIFDAEGKVNYFMEWARDISEAKKAQESLAESEARYRSIFNNSAIGIGVRDIEHNYIEFNDYYVDMLGYSAEELKYLKTKDITHPDDIDISLQNLDMIKTGKSKMLSYEKRYIRKDGKIVWGEVSVRPLHNSQGEIYAISGVVKDITEKKKFEKELKRSENKFKTAFLVSPDSINVNLLESGVYVEINEGFTELSGYTRDDVIGKSSIDINIWKNLEDRNRLLEVLRRDGFIENLEAEFVLKDGSTKTALMSARIIDYGGQKAILSITRDLTERLQYQKSLQESEERLQYAVRGTRDGLWDWNVQTNEAYHSDRYAEMLGYLPGELPYTSAAWENLIHPDDKEKAYQKINDYLEGKTDKYENTFRMRRKDGSYRWMTGRGQIIYDDEGKPLRLVGFNTDITAQKKAFDELNMRNEFIQVVLDNLPIGIALNEINSGIATYLNKKFEEIYGWPKEEMVDINDFFEKVYPDEGYRNKIKNQVTKDMESLDPERMRWKGIIITTKDNKKKIVDAVNIPLFEQNTIVSTVMDVTNERKAQSELKESEERYRSLVDNSLVGIFISQNERIIFCNEAFAKVFGYDFASNITGIQESKLIDIKSRKRLNFDSHNNQNMAHFEIKGKRLDGSDIDMEIIYKSIIYKGKVATQGILIDITEKKKVRDEMQRISKLESIGTLAGGIAHNFKNMLAAMSLSVEIAKMKPEKVKIHLDRISKSIDQATALATRFQTFSKGDEPIKSVIDLNEIIEEAVSIALSGSQVIAKMEKNNDLWLTNADPRQMNEVFMNLIINANQAMPGGGEIEIKTENIALASTNEAALPAGDYVKVDICDMGDGIEEKVLDKIFEPFFTTKNNGNGLGLATVHYIIQKHEGNILAFSEPGKGAKFTVFLPATNQKQGRKDGVSDSITLKDDLNVLLLDDEIDIRENMLEMADILNINMQAASNGYKAFQIYLKALTDGNPFDVVILDLTIKGSDMDGAKTLAQLQRIDPDVKAIVFSGHSDKPIVANYKKYGFSEILDKPISLNKLRKVLSKF